MNTESTNKLSHIVWEDSATETGVAHGYLNETHVDGNVHQGTNPIFTTRHVADKWALVSHITDLTNAGGSFDSLADAKTAAFLLAVSVGMCPATYGTESLGADAITSEE